MRFTLFFIMFMFGWSVTAHAQELPDKVLDFTMCREARHIVRVQVETDDIVEVIHGTGGPSNAPEMGYATHRLSGKRLHTYKGPIRTGNVEFYAWWEWFEKPKLILKPGDYVVFLVDIQKSDKEKGYSLIEQPNILPYSSALEKKMKRYKVCRGV